MMSNAARPMQGKICMVTGATSGIGFVTARALAQQGATVVIVARNAEKCVQTVAEIQRQGGNPQIEFMLADLSLLGDVRKLAAQFKQKYDQLHVLINNAGAVFVKRSETPEGFEQTFALNHLSVFCLTNLLLDVLMASEPARIINTSSIMHQLVTLDFADLQNQRRYRGWHVYAQSKLANLLFTYELARRLEGSAVTINALHPGNVATNFGTNNGLWFRWLRRIVNLGAIDAEKGAQTTIYLATAEHVAHSSGKYFVQQRPVVSSAASYDRNLQGRLWAVSASMIGLES